MNPRQHILNAARVDMYANNGKRDRRVAVNMDALLKSETGIVEVYHVSVIQIFVEQLGPQESPDRRDYMPRRSGSCCVDRKRGKAHISPLIVWRGQRPLPVEP